MGTSSDGHVQRWARPVMGTSSDGRRDGNDVRWLRASRCEEIVDETRSDRGKGLDKEIYSNEEDPSDGNSSTSSDVGSEDHPYFEISKDRSRLELIDFIKKNIRSLKIAAFTVAKLKEEISNL
ncbi:hypothetical protein LWI28_014671 [Acer negundo]|uniref:Uncharacterized protein n=1 Tax=Acer negundo TaxID=4023 RepID=A0AAD5NUN0_ACENE|nr:hypothetical protein LWI28_014671 [Acer negundo]